MKKLFLIILNFFVIVFILWILFKVRIKNVEVVGLTKQSNEEFEAGLFESEFDRTSIVFLIKDLFREKSRLKYIENYEVTWITPFSIKVAIKEKDYVGFVKKDIQNVYFDRDGTITDIKSDRETGVAEIRGLNFGGHVKGEKLALDNEILLNDMLKMLYLLKNKNLPVFLVEFGKEDRIDIYVDKIKVLFGNSENVDIKLKRLLEIYPKIKDLEGTLDLSSARENMEDEQYIFKKE